MTAVAVVGGTGFLGRHVVASLEQAGYSVRTLSRRVGCDGLRLNPDALHGMDAVVNLAGIKREEGDQTFQAVHVNLVHRLVQAMKTAGVFRLVHVSVVVARPAPGIPYNDTKWKGEEVVRASGLDWTILRPGVIYGEGDDMLTHLALMIRMSPVFPIVGNGTAPMRPVDVWDVAAAVTAALSRPRAGKLYEIVGPERLELRTVVQRVAEALALPLSIWRTPVALMRPLVRIMEVTMRQPLSTRAQLAMLVEGLDGDPGPALHDLGLTTAPFTVERLRSLLAKTNRTNLFALRLLSAEKPGLETAKSVFWLVLALASFALTFIFSKVPDPWAGMTVAMGIALIGTMCLKPVRRRLNPSVLYIVAGLGAGGALYGLTLVVVAALPTIWPEWKSAARTVYAWRSGYSKLFLVPSLITIVIAEEMLWRGVVARFLMERWGRAAGIAAGAMIYALAHWATLNPLLLAAALGCGLLWGWLYAVTDNLVAPTVSHLMWDVLLLFVFPIAT